MAYRFEWNEDKARSNLSSTASVSTKPALFSMIRWHESLTMNYTRQTKSAK
jgi:uncharacterized DUF497 family protein